MEREFDLDNYELSPVNQGLGFHHEKKTAVFKKEVRRRRAGQEAEPSGLQSFYNYRPPEPAPAAKPEAKQTKLKTAGEVDRFCAFLLDLAVLGAGFAGVVLSFLLMAQLPVAWSTLTWGSRLWPHLGVLGGLLFVFYFTLLDSSGTVGKRLLGLSLTDRRGRRPGLEQSLARALVCLAGLGLLGLPLLVNTQGRCSRTQVVKR